MALMLVATLLFGFTDTQGKIILKGEPKNNQIQTKENSVDWQRLENSFYMITQKDYKVMVPSKKLREVTEFKGFVLVDQKWVAASFDWNKMMPIYTLDFPIDFEDTIRLGNAFASGAEMAAEHVYFMDDEIQATSYFNMKNGDQFQADVFEKKGEKCYYTLPNITNGDQRDRFIDVSKLLSDKGIRKQLIASDLDLATTKGYAIDMSSFASASTLLLSDGKNEYFLFLDNISFGVTSRFLNYPMPDKNSSIYNEDDLKLTADFKPFMLYTVHEVYRQTTPILEMEYILFQAQKKEYEEKQKAEKILLQTFVDENPKTAIQTKRIKKD